MATQTADHVEPNYIAIFIYLSILTAIELVIAYERPPKLFLVSSLVSLAFAKAVLVAMYFMHLRFERRTLAIIAFIPAILVTFLTFMLLPDLTTRLWTSIDAHERVRASDTAPPAATAAP